MKVKGFFKENASHPHIIDGVTFHVKRLNQAQLIRFEGMMRAGASDIFTYDVKRCFARDHLTGWEGLLYDNNDEVEFSTENAIELLTDNSYDDLFASIYDFSLTLRRDIDKSTEEDLETAKK